MLGTTCLMIGLALATNDGAWAAVGAAGDLRFETRNGDLYVRRGKARARLEVDEAHPDMHPDLPLSVRAKTDGTTWTLRVQTNCQGEKTMRFSTAGLEARLESAAGRALARRKQWDAAAVVFARAIALDPSATSAAIDLAAAQARGGHAREAVVTLVAAATRDRLLVVWRMALDRDLAAVASAPELRALAARSPGHATLAKLGKARAAFAVEGGLILWDRVVGNMVNEDPPGRMELRVADAATGRLLARLPYGRGDETRVNRALADLGFEIEAVRPRALALAKGDADPELSGRLDGMRVVVKQGRVRLLADGRVAGEARVGSPFDGGWAAKVRGGVLIATSVNIGDGCGAWVYDDIVWIPIVGP